MFHALGQWSARAAAVSVFLAMPAVCGAQANEGASLQRSLERAEARIAALEAKVSDLGGSPGTTWLDEARAEEVRALVREVLADADARASLLNEGVRAGYDNGFFIQSADGNHKLKVRGFLAVRHIFNDRENTEDDQVSGFEIARTRFGFMGHVIDPSWKFKIWTGDNNSGDNLLLDAYITKKFDHGLSVTAGQFKLPFFREYLVSEVNLQFVERTLLSAAVAGSYTQGVKADYQNEAVRLTLSVNDGRKEINSTFDDDGSEFAVTGRAEWKVFGPWSQYKTYDAFRGSEPALVLGVASHYQEGESDSDMPDEWCWTVDGSWQGDGWNLVAAVVGCHSEAGSKGDFIGFLVQGGYFVTDNVELLARYEHANSDLSGVEDLSIATAGVSVFFARFNARWTTDVGYAFNPVADRWDSSAAGYLVDTGDEDGQTVVRSQLQLLF